MKIILSFILFIGLITFIFSQVPVWNLTNSSINLLLENSTTFNYTIYKDTKLSLIKEIRETNDDISQQNYVKFNGTTFNTTWEGIQQIYEIEGNIYVCPIGKNHLSFYSNNEFKELIEKNFTIEQEWDFTCYYLDSIKVIFMSYLHSSNKYIYLYRISEQNWRVHRIQDGFLDIIWPSDLIKNARFYLFSIFIMNNSINLGRIEVYINIDNSVSMNLLGFKSIIERLNKSYAYFDDQNYFYWITHNDTHFYSGYSKTPIEKNSEGPQIDKVEIVNNSDSPFEHFGKVKFNYVKLIRNTKYAFYEINREDKIYHGIIDVKLNKILFNSDENIKDFKPYSKNALLVVTDKSAYKLCTFALNEKGDDCIDQCPEGQTFILDPTNNNHCGDQCPDGYYKDSNGTCQVCNSNCLTCKGPSIEGNNNCLSCDPNKNESKLIDAEGFPNNCVSECPNNTIRNGAKCIKINNSEKKKKNLIYIFIILMMIIIIVLGLILFKKCRSKKKDDEQLITNINNKINENDLKENRIVD